MVTDVVVYKRGTSALQAELVNNGIWVDWILTKEMCDSLVGLMYTESVCQR